MSECVRCRVSGRVQGVYFRASTQRQALALGLSGHAHNLPDGSVEVLVCGETAAREQLCAWLWEGPSRAQVEQVSCMPIDCRPPSGFHTG